EARAPHGSLGAIRDACGRLDQGRAAACSMSAPLLYYPILLEGEYASISDLCEHRGFDPKLVGTYVRNAEIERSPLVLCDRIAFDDDDPELRICAALRLEGDGVSLWAAMVGEASADRDEVLEVIAHLRNELPTKEIVLAEFVP